MEKEVFIGFGGSRYKERDNLSKAKEAYDKGDYSTD